MMAVDYTGFAHPKGTRRELEKPREDREDAKRRQMVVKAAFARDKFTCRCCGHKKNLHPHEIRYKSQGGSPYDLSNVLTLCRLCHLEGEHGRTKRGKTLQILGHDANGPVQFAGSWIEYIRQFRAKAGKQNAR